MWKRAGKFGFLFLTIVGGIGTLLKFLRWILDAVGTAQTASGIVEDRGAILNWFIAMPQFVPLALFLLGVFGLLCLKFGPPQKWFEKPPPPQPIFLAIDQLREWLYKGQALENRFQFPDKPKPNFGECAKWDENTTVCARQQVFADIIRPNDMARFREPWDELACRKAESTLDEYGVLESVNDTGRSVYRYIFGRVKRLEELLAKIDGKAPLIEANAFSFDVNNAFEVDAEAVSDLQNQTEQGADLRGKPGWCMDCVISIHNRHPTQGLGDVTFRVIGIAPPMMAAPSHHPRTQDAMLRRVQFGFTDLPSRNALAGDQTGHIRLFKANKQIMFSEAIKEPPGKSRFTILHFDGVWPDGVKTIFAPEGEYFLTVEVAGSGVGRKEEHFALSFPMEINKSVFWIRNVDPSCEQAKQCFRETAKLLNSVNIPSFHAFWQKGAAQLPSSESIAEACRLLIANSHEDPFAGLEEYIPARDYYAFFDFLKHDASNAGMNFGEGNAYLEAAERWHDKQQYGKPSSDARLRMTFRKVGTC
jgi:hypothetical protein